ncbi:Hypothetical predicted protein [Pelobates cultripes]|uniref:Uncharacterized protein n=1 Tax=Pelobates cultripes TaxID=61616 RepID=A0AAD1R806_PELCU|nr:Hypothetical predicted protein [Pelobates cultripes]
MAALEQRGSQPERPCSAPAPPAAGSGLLSRRHKAPSGGSYLLGGSAMRAGLPRLLPLEMQS